MKKLLLCVFWMMSSLYCSADWELWEPGAAWVIPLAASRVELGLPPELRGGEELVLALRCVDVFGNVSARSGSVQVRIPDGGRIQGAKMRVELVRAPPLSGQEDPMIPVPENLTARVLPGGDRVELTWRVQADIETRGVQVLRFRPAPPIAAGEGLVFWRFPEAPPGEDGIPARVHPPGGLHPKLQSAELRIGDGYRMEANAFRNAYGVRLAGERWGDVADRPDRYVAIRLEPKPGEAVDLHQFMVGLWSMDSGRNLEHRLVYSLDGFQTCTEIPLHPEGALLETGRRLGSGVATRVDLRSQAALQGLRRPVEFRLYLWGTNEKGLGKMGAESTRENWPDVQIHGE